MQVAAAEASGAPAAPRLPLSARGMGARSPVYLVSDLMKPSAEPVPLSFLITAKKMRWKRCALATDHFARVHRTALCEHQRTVACRELPATFAYWQQKRWCADVFCSKY